MDGKAEAILQEAQKRFAAAEVYVESGETRAVEFENNNLKRVAARQYRGVGLRVIHEERIGFASTTDLRDPSKLVEMAAASAQFGEKARFEFPAQPDGLPDVDVEDPALREVQYEQLVEMGREALAMSRSADKEYLFSATVSTKLSEARLLNTNGLDIAQTFTDMAASVEIETVIDEGLLEVYEQKGWGQPFQSVTDIATVALEKMRQGRVVVKGKQEVVPVLFTPKAVHNLLSPVMIALSGKHVHKGSSVLAGRLGEEVLDKRISIFEDPHVPFAPGSARADSEGLPTRRFSLIENGALESYLLDLQTAGLLGMEPTASGYRSYATQPSPAASNTVVGAGEETTEDMIAAMKRGIVVDQTLGSGQSNILAGEISVNVELGFLIEDGEVKGRVKDCMVAGNVYDLLSRVEGVGSERQWIGAEFVPAICVGGIKLAAQG